MPAPLEDLKKADEFIRKTGFTRVPLKNEQDDTVGVTINSRTHPDIDPQAVLERLRDMVPHRNFKSLPQAGDGQTHIVPTVKLQGEHRTVRYSEDEIAGKIDELNNNIAKAPPMRTDAIQPRSLNPVKPAEFKVMRLTGATGGEFHAVGAYMDSEMAVKLQDYARDKTGENFSVISSSKQGMKKVMHATKSGDVTHFDNEKEAGEKLKELGDKGLMVAENKTGRGGRY